MKGPFLRLRYDLHRAWECQSCHAKVSTPGTTTTQMCDCRVEETGKRVSMKMVSDGLRRVRLAFESDLPRPSTATSNSDSNQNSDSSKNPAPSKKSDPTAKNVTSNKADTVPQSEAAKTDATKSQKSSAKR